MDDDKGAGGGTYRVGMMLDALSVDELEENIEMLKEEIGRLKKEIEKKKARKSEAENAFNL